MDRERFSILPTADAMEVCFSVLFLFKQTLYFSFLFVSFRFFSFLFSSFLSFRYLYLAATTGRVTTGRVSTGTITTGAVSTTGRVAATTGIQCGTTCYNGGSQDPTDCSCKCIEVITSIDLGIGSISKLKSKSSFVLKLIPPSVLFLYAYFPLFSLGMEAIVATVH